jgi:hypothetical protein
LPDFFIAPRLYPWQTLLYLNHINNIAKDSVTHANLSMAGGRVKNMSESVPARPLSNLQPEWTFHAFLIILSSRPCPARGSTSYTISLFYSLLIMSVYFWGYAARILMCSALLLTAIELGG